MASFPFRFLLRRSTKILLHLVFPLLVVSVTIAVGKSEDGDGICGTVRTKLNQVVTFKDEETLLAEEFDNVQIGKLNNATFFPVQERRCVIQVCGFTSFTAPMKPGGCIGSFSDMMDCLTIKKSGQTRLAFNNRFNTSSIACGCYKEYSILGMACEAKCHFKKQFLDTNKHAWKGNECAVLFRQRDCQDCYFTAFKLEIDSEFVTDNTIHISSLIVRDKCTVAVRVPAIKRFCTFPNSSGIFNYTNKQRLDTSFTPVSAYQSDPETYTCTCLEDGATVDSSRSTVTSPSTLQETPSSSSPTEPLSNKARTEKENYDCSSTNAIQYLTLIIVGLILFLGLVGVFIGVKVIRRTGHSNNLTLTERQTIKHTGADEVRAVSKV